MKPGDVPAAGVFGILLLFLLLVPAGSATAPSWTAAASPGDEISSIMISHDGSTILAGGDQLIVLSPEGTRVWAGWSGTMLDLSGDGGYIVTSQGASVRLFDRQGTLLWDKGLTSTVTSVSISPDAAVIAAGGGREVQSWYNSGAGLGENTTGVVQVVRISPVKDQILVGTADALESFNLSYVPNWEDDSYSPSTLTISSDGTNIVIPNGNHVLMLHGSGTELWDRSFDGGNIISLAYSRDGSTIVAGRDDSTVLVLDRNGNLLWKGTAGLWVTSVAVSDNGSIIATGSIDRKVHVFDRQGRELVNATTENAIKSQSVAISGDGSLVAATDGAKIYGFSTTGIPVPVRTPEGTTTQVTAGNTTLPGRPGTTAQVTTATTRAAGTARAPVSGTTMAGLPWFLAPAAFALLLVTRR